MFHDFVKSSLLSNAYTWNLKNDTDGPICRKGMDTQMWGMALHRGMHGESSINTHTRSGVRRRAGGKLLCSSGSPASGDDLEGGGRGREGMQE